MAELKALAQRFYDEVMAKGDLNALDALVDDTFVDHEEMPGLTNDKAGVRDFVTMVRDAFPDLSVEVVAMAVDEPEVWAQVVMRGTHRGTFMGIPATGRAVEMPMFDRVRFRDDRVVEHWGLSDNLLMMQQLGVVPEEP